MGVFFTFLSLLMVVSHLNYIFDCLGDCANVLVVQYRPEGLNFAASVLIDPQIQVECIFQSGIVRLKIFVSGEKMNLTVIL
jgi:hypothetical protein